MTNSHFHLYVQSLDEEEKKTAHRDRKPADIYTDLHITSPIEN